MRVLLIPLLVLAACGRAPAPRNPLAALPVDSARVPSPDSAASWGYRRSIATDLDGDRRPERLVVASDVVVDPRGNPLWEDGHRWAVYAELPAGERILLYAAFVPNGSVDVAALTADDAGRRHVLVHERTPGRLRVITLEYARAGASRLLSDGYYHVEQWLPGVGSPNR